MTQLERERGGVDRPIEFNITIFVLVGKDKHIIPGCIVSLGRICSVGLLYRTSEAQLRWGFRRRDVQKKKAHEEDWGRERGSSTLGEVCCVAMREPQS